MLEITTDILVIGGGTGGTAAAIQAARRGAEVVLVSEFDWLGGMLTAAGVSAPDGNELAALQTGLWGAFLRELQQRQLEGLDHAWVSLFTYDPALGAQIFADWVDALPNLKWIRGQQPTAILREGDRILGAQFQDFFVRADITLDATELGDVLALAEVPHRWGWDLESREPSFVAAQQTEHFSDLIRQHPVQAATWVVVMQDWGEGGQAPEILAPPGYRPDRYAGAWHGYEVEEFLNYGRLPGDRFMINWPQCGNDYGVGINRLVESPTARQNFLQEAFWQSQGFAHWIQSQLGRRYGLAESTFPTPAVGPGGGAYALYPYYRESRRLEGVLAVREADILPVAEGQVAALPTDATGAVSAIAVGNYPNDHHYPGYRFPLQPKSMRWGGRQTGTPFTIPYEVLIPATVDGLLACEKNISVSHIANGATRLQPVVLGIGQAAGMAAALCVEQGCQPRQLSVRSLQTALLNDAAAPAAVVPLLNLCPSHPDWQAWQHYYLDHPEAYPADGNCPCEDQLASEESPEQTQLRLESAEGLLHKKSNPQEYQFVSSAVPPEWWPNTIDLITLQPRVNDQLQQLEDRTRLRISGRVNWSGNWLIAEHLQAL